MNTWSHTWRFERANLMLTTFIREKTTGYNPLYQRHPELWEKCSIRIQIDPVAPLSAEEESYLLSIPLADRMEFPLQSESASLASPAWRRGHLPVDRFVCLARSPSREAGLVLPNFSGFLGQRFL